MARMGGRCQCKEKVTYLERFGPYKISVYLTPGQELSALHLIFNSQSTDPFVRYKNLEPALCLELKKIVEAMKSPGKGILAVDESPATLDKKFQEMDITSTESIRRDYRQMLLSTDKTRLNKCISSVILHHETVYQKTSNDVEFIEFVRQKNLIPGVKVDKGLVNLFGTDNETTTQGLDELQERCIQYKKDGCHFTKWRCTFSISDSQPSHLAMLTNAHVLARYASISQSARLVPIIEPEILNQGEHGINRSRQVHEEMLSILFRTLNEHRVYLEGIILKPSMVLAGLDHARYCKPQIIAESTVLALQRTVPAAVPMIAFLSGGQTDEETTLNLNAINQYEGIKPWTLTFCFGRALQNEAIKVWQGDSGMTTEAQEIFLKRAEISSAAAQGILPVEDIEKCLKSTENII